MAFDHPAAYGSFGGPPSWAELERFFFLDDAGRGQVKARGCGTQPPKALATGAAGHR